MATTTTPCTGECKQAEILLDLSVAWVLLCSFLVMSMQLGFAMLEVGSVREAHRMTVLAKNILDSSVSCMAFWAYVGITSSRLTFDADGVVQYHLTTFHCAFCATAVTICSGAMAERTHMGAYLTYAALMAGIIYPVIADGAWGTPGSLLYKEFHDRISGANPYHDFAGGGVVHLTGGCAAMVGNMLIGRRILLPEEEDVQALATADGRLQEIPLSTREKEIRTLEREALKQERMLRPEGGWPRRFDDPSRDRHEFKAVNYLQVMGMFTLWVGWYAFNSGSTLSMDRSAGLIVGVVAWNTTMAAAGGIFGSYVYCMCWKTQLDVQLMTNGAIAGLVAITSGCDVASGSLATLIGAVAGLLVHPLSSWIWQTLKFDDPVDVVAVHAACGFWGLMAVAFCKPDCNRYAALAPDYQEQLRFCSKDHSMGHQLLAQLWGGLTVVVWTSLWSGAVWGVFAFSECTRALEVKYLEEAVGLLGQMAVLEPANQQVTTLEPTAEMVERWQRVARCSPLARGIMRRHEWRDGCFAGGTSKDLWRIWHLRHDLQEARGERAETALEIADKCIMPRLASWLHACCVTRELAWLRLRITPAAEISGLGAAYTDGGQLLQAVRRAMALLVEARRDQHSFHSPLRREIRELSMTVQSQEVLLEALLRSSRNRRHPRNPRRPLGSVPEDPESGGEPSAGCHASAARGSNSAALEQAPTDAGTSQPVSQVGSEDFVVAEGLPVSIEAVTGGLGRLVPRSNSHSSDHTMSDRSAGALTPRSVAEDTPPPSVIGRVMRSRPRSSHGQVDPAANELVAQLAGVLQTHQHLLSALQQVASSPSGSTTPDSRGSPARGRHNQLQQALQSMSAQLQQSPPATGSGAPHPTRLGAGTPARGHLPATAIV